MDSLIKKSINSKTWRAYRDDGIEIPGVSSFDKTVLNFRRKS